MIDFLYNISESVIGNKLIDLETLFTTVLEPMLNTLK